MGSLAIFPALLVFGPQTSLPTLDVLAQLRQDLIEHSQLSGLRRAIKNLSDFWQSLAEFDPSLKTVQGDKYLRSLQRWIDDGVFPHYVDNPPNVFALPLTVILQLILYIRYLNSLNIKDAHRHLLQAIEPGGAQGFCVGFLTAIAVNCAQNERDISEIGAISLRLAVCVGAYVDRDGSFAEPPNDTACIAVRWRTEHIKEQEIVHVVKNYPDVCILLGCIYYKANLVQKAYISSINDDACVTITAPASDIYDITETFQARGVRVSTVHVRGRFHSAIHTSSMEKILEFSDTSDGLLFPTLDKLQVPLRSSLSGNIVTTGSLTKLALENMLLQAPDWYGTVKAAMLQMPERRKFVGFVGFGNHIPASLLQSPGLEVLCFIHEASNPKRNIKAPHVNGFTKGTTVNGDHVFTNESLLPTLPKDPEYPPHSIAVVGMACRLPEADSIDEFWQLLLSGTSIVEPAPDRLNLPKTGDYSDTKWWGSFLRDPDAFDHKFFKKSSREALSWDPQLRILLEVVYEAMESSGYFGTVDKSLPEDWGCYIGAGSSNWCDNVSCHPPSAYATTGTLRSFFSGAISHHFGWTGPACRYWRRNPYLF
jgi:hypothetical protein